ncbi:MAG TPA: DUF3089 domain-containing protein [Allosphingosinicella sp.]
MKKLVIGAAALLLSAVPCAAQETTSPPPLAPVTVEPSPDYGNPASWLCRPGRDDACAKPLATAGLDPNGYGPVGATRPAANPAADCFYIYPTISRDPGDNSDLNPGIEEQAVVAVQLARFAGVCKTYAPIYRQATLTALQKALTGVNVERNFGLAYADVRNAWRHYLENDNKGRPFVLIGHSQGSIMLSLLLQEIENSPAAGRMLSAMLIGYNIEVPEGQTVGGTFKKTPLCTRAGETGCVVTFVSFRATNPPPPGSLFGRSARPGMTIGCTNPATLARGSAMLDSYWYAGPGLTSTQDPVAWSSAGAPPATFLRTDDLVTAACVNRGQVGYLAVSVNADPDDGRTDRIPGDVMIGGKIVPGWGLHLADMSLAMGDLIELVEAQSEAYRRARRR